VAASSETPSQSELDKTVLSIFTNLTPLTTVTVTMPISTLKGSWKRLLNEDRLKRSSQVVSVIGDKVCIFGGEVLARQPIDNQVDVFSLKSGNIPHFIHPTNMVLPLNPFQTRTNSTPNRCLERRAHV
jgi:hypothetical protein